MSCGPTFRRTEYRATLKVCIWNFAVALVSSKSRIAADPRHRGAPLRLNALRKSAESPTFTSDQLNGFFWAGRRRNLLSAMSPRAAPCAITLSSRCCANCAYSEVTWADRNTSRRRYSRRPPAIPRTGLRADGYTIYIALQSKSICSRSHFPRPGENKLRTHVQ